MRPFATSCWLVLLALLPVHALAEELPTLRDTTSVRSAGMGDAVRGFAGSSEALLVQPAGIAATVRFNGDLMAMFEPAYDYRVLAAASIDSKLNAKESFPLAGGAGYYNYTSGEGEAERHGSVVVLGLGLPLYPETVFVGATGKYLRLGGAVEASAVTLDAGAMVKLFRLLSVGAAGYNLINVYNAEARRAWGFGAAVGDDRLFHVDFDLQLDRSLSTGENVLTYRAGAEYLIAEVVMPRVGYVHDNFRDVRKVTAGVSVLFGPMAVEAAYQHALGSKGRYFAIGLRLLDN
ncbi:MAG TPA: hypothetical protein DFS52_20910 [Myxococcales bacterium]|jgi:hypothetical protein|nr:hypothetical protein [Myxococcales bacterium]